MHCDVASRIYKVGAFSWRGAAQQSFRFQDHGPSMIPGKPPPTDGFTAAGRRETVKTKLVYSQEKRASKTSVDGTRGDAGTRVDSAERKTFKILDN
jgi:hypothetical protein